MKKYAIVGTGGRGLDSYARPLVRDFADCARLVALCDKNVLRAQYVSGQVGGNIPCYDAEHFDDMLAEQKPDVLIITTVDAFHSEYIIRALDAGLEVISEKPMTTDAAKCNAILEAERRNNRRIHVTFNCRFMPHIARVKQLLLDGAVGRVLNVDFEWMLDTSHGADYFHRWHSIMENSSGLMVHKATHHFDIVNFLIAQDPVSVYALGDLKVYGKDRMPGHGVRCSQCEKAAQCPFNRKITDKDERGLYLECESNDGYFRDRCAFSNEINIYDNMNLVVGYSGGAQMSYSLIAHSPYEGWRMSISGTDGRLETWQTASGPDAGDPRDHVLVYDRKGQKIEYSCLKTAGTHGGGDDRMRQMLIRGGMEDLLGQCSGSRDGAMSILIGIAANQSIATGLPVKICDLVDFGKYGL